MDTGDRIEGNGLYDSSTPKGLFYYDIYREQSVDIITIGNHELYQSYAADRELNTTVPNYKSKYIASNLDVIDRNTGERVPLAQRYRKFTTKNQGIEIVAFGFLFDFTGNANNSFVQKAEDTVKEAWFQEAIREENPDVFVVAGHVGVRMPEYKTIFNAIRKQNPSTPIVFFGGHVHVRDATQYDSRSFAMASGRYFETLGWMSVDGIKGAAQGFFSSLPKFTRKYIDTNLYGMHYHSGTNETTFPTALGTRVSAMIARARKALDLDYQFGCAPKNLWTSRVSYPDKDSIFSWLQDDVFPETVINKDRQEKPRLAIMNTGGVRFDVFKGPFTRDSTYLISPFTSGFKYVPDVPYSIAKNVLPLLNSAGKIFSSDALDTSQLAIPEHHFAAFATQDKQAEAELELRSLHGDRSSRGDIPLTSGYTTRDDLGNDGDDTIHEPIKFYNVPNCVQSEIAFPEGEEPATVDLVFIDFIQPWIIPALQLSGGHFTNDDIKVYMEGTMASKMAEWISKNWQEQC